MRWVFLLAMIALAEACTRAPASRPAPTAAAFTPRLDHLRALFLDVSVRGTPEKALALYALAPDYRPAASPARDGAEGIACVDDAARGAVVFLRDYETTRDPRSRADAQALLDFVTRMESAPGEYTNFIRQDGTSNDTAPTSKPSFSWWAARALWALGEAERVLRPHDAALADAYRPFLDRAIARAGAEKGLVAGSMTATSEALLGLVAARAEPTLVARYASLLVPGEGRWGARPDGAEAWHAWGDRSTEALARAAILLGKPELAAVARREADGLWTRELLAGTRIATPTDEFPQIAYGVSPIVGGLLALADATGDRTYATLAGLHAAWFLGANPGGMPMYDVANGRNFDGIDGTGKVNRNAGAESTVEALLALGLVAGDPDASAALAATPQGSRTALAEPPPDRIFHGPAGSLTLTEQGGIPKITSGGAPVSITYWPAANPIEVALAQRLAEEFQKANPDIHVDVQPIPAGRSSEEVLLAAIVARSTPDVCSNISSTLVARLARAKGVVRLDTLPATAARLRERNDEAMLAPARLDDGGIYALPWKTNPLMLLYNKRQLAAAGVAPPRTHSELLEASRKLLRDEDHDGRPDHWALWATLKTTWFERFYDVYPTYLAASGGTTLLQHGKVVFENDAMVDAFALFREGFAKGYFPRTNFEGTDPFIAGTVAMKLIGPWFLEQLERLKVPGLEYDVVPVPVPDGPPRGESYAFGDWKSIAVFSTSAHPEAAARFVSFLTSPAADALLVERSAQLPYRRGLARDPRFTGAVARWRSLAPYTELVERSRDLDPNADAVEVLDVLSEAYEASAIFGQKPPRDAVHAAAEEAKELLRDH